MKKTTFIIHFRRDCNDRIFNLKTILKYLSSLNPHEIILVNDDSQIDPIMKWVKSEYPSINLLFCENSGEFKKSHSFNEAAKVSTGNILCFYDVDVLIDPKQLEEASDLINNETYDHVYPFNGIFVDVKKCFFDNINSFNMLTSQVTDNTLGFFNGNINVISTMSPGGCNMISRKAFDRMGGYDDRFIGWGFEDTDFRDRSKAMNRLTYLEGEKYLFHLEHSSHCDSDRSKQPHYINNANTYYKNIRPDRN